MPAAGFEKDLFISYAHLDNKPLTEEQEGWVSQFHKRLGAVLAMRLSCTVEIRRDLKLRCNDVFGEEISDVVTPESAPAEAEAQPKRIYLICDQRDRPATLALRKHFKNRGFASHLPVFEGDAAEIREANRKRLLECDLRRVKRPGRERPLPRISLATLPA